MTIKRPSFTQEEALAFHAGGKPGKIEITPTKPMATQRDLASPIRRAWPFPCAQSPSVRMPSTITRPRAISWR